MAGVSHFLEHMVFKGTPTRSADDVNREFDEMGAHYNAFTSEENTVYYAAVLPEYQDRAVDLLADILRPSLREEDFDTEKQVILEEIQMYEDQPPFGADDKCRALYFGSHPLGRSVLGTAESVGELPVEAMRDYFRRRYSPATSCWPAPGGSTSTRWWPRAERLLRRLGSRWRRAATIEPAAAATAFRCCTRKRPRSSTCCSWPPGPPPKTTTATPPNCWPPCWATTRAAGSIGNWSIPGLAEHASLSHGEYQGAGMMMTYMSCEPEQAADNLQRILERLPPGRGRGRHGGRTGAGQEQDSLADRAVQRAAARPAVRRRQRLGLSPRVSPDRGANWTRWPASRSTILPPCLAKYPLTRPATVTIGPLAELPRAIVLLLTSVTTSQCRDSARRETAQFRVSTSDCAPAIDDPRPCLAQHAHVGV